MAAIKVGGRGHVWKYTTTGNVTSGSLLFIGGVTSAVALETAVTGKEIAVESGAEWILPKKAAANTNWAPGGRVYTIATGGVNKLTGVAVAGKLIGFGVKTTVTGATTGQVVLMPCPSPLETQA